MSHSLAVRAAAFGALEPSASASLTRVREVLDALATRDVHGEVLTAVRHFPAREAQWAEFPAWVHADLAAAYNAKGIRQLYTHQTAAAESVHAGKNIVIVTPTASAKLSATTCLCLTLFSPTRTLVPFISSPPKPWRKTNSPNSTT